MFDLSLGEIGVVAIVATLVLGPEELPTVLRALGRWVGKARTLAKDVNGVLTKMIEEAEIKETKERVTADVHYIRDMYGNLQRTYNVEELMKADATPKVPVTATEAALETPKHADPVDA